jgi:hypothetical protein
VCQTEHEVGQSTTRWRTFMDSKRARHLEWVGPVVFNEESVEIPEERHHQQQEYVERGKSLNHQQSRKLLGLRDTVSSAFVNTNN